MKSITVLKLKLSSDNSDELERSAKMCRRARNAAVEDWLLRQRGKPETDKQSNRLIGRKGVANDKPKTESTKLYHAITAAVPELGTTVASMIAQQIASHLSAKVDWRRGTTENGKRACRKDAVLDYEDRIPFFTSLEIPIRSALCQISFGDALSFSAGGIGKQPICCTLSTRDLKTGHKAIIRDLSIGVKKLSDSRLLKKNDNWYWYVPVQFETELRSEFECHLWPVVCDRLVREDTNAQQDRPFRFIHPGGRPWHIGDGRYLLAQSERLVGLRKQIGWRYRQRMGAGHGRSKIDEAVIRRVKQLENIRTEVRRRAISDVVRQCIRSSAGRLVYHEPTGPAKLLCWFHMNGLDWDWTRFSGDLKNACARQGIEVSVSKMKYSDGKDKIKD